MTHEEIEAAIERLEKLGSNGFIFDTDIVDAVNDSTDMFEVRDTIIALLEQADTVSGGKWMKLPKDADGVPIRINDKMTLNYSGRVVEVMAVGECGFYYADGKTALLYYSEAACCRHYNKPTVEDVLRVFARTVAPEIVWDDEMYDELFAKYAAKLRELMADDQ